MFPTDPIRNYINLSFTTKINELAKIYATEVTAARQNFPSPGGNRLREIMQPSVRHAQAKIDAWVQIVRDACKEANRPVDNEVRAYILAEVHNQCEGARIHTARALASTLQRESAEHLPGVRESLTSRLDLQIKQIETDIGRELKIEELREDVRKSATPEVSARAPEKEPIPLVLHSTDKRPWYRRLSLDHKLLLSIGIPTIALAVLGILVMIFLPELRIVLGLDRQPKPDPKISIPAPRPPSDQPAPKTPTTKDSATSEGAPATKPPGPTVQANGPSQCSKRNSKRCPQLRGSTGLQSWATLQTG
jgi:hypothetical protein